MNCCWILLLLFFCGQNGNGICGQADRGCGCGCEVEPPKPPCCNREPEPCPCDEPRFEPQFESRPFSGNGSTCGCEEK